MPKLSWTGFVCGLSRNDQGVMLPRALRLAQNLTKLWVEAVLTLQVSQIKHTGKHGFEAGNVVFADV